MPLSLNDFKNIVSFSNDFNNAFVTLNDNRAGITIAGLGEVNPVEPTPAQNMEIRAELFKALVDSGKCQMDTIQKLMTRLGFGASAEKDVLSTKLTKGEIQDILAEVKAAPMKEANRTERTNFLQTLQADGLLSNPQVKADAQKLLGLQPDGDLTQPLTEEMKKNVRDFCVDNLKKSFLGTEMKDLFIGQLRSSGLPDKVINEAAKRFDNVKTENDARKLVGYVNSRLIELPVITEKAEMFLKDLSTQTGVNFEDLKKGYCEKVLSSLDNQYSSTSCDKMENVSSMQEFFNKKLEKICNTKKKMCQCYNDAKADLGPKSTDMLLSFIKQPNTKDISGLLQVIKHKTIGHAMLNLLQKEDVTEAEIMQEAMNLTKQRKAFFDDAIMTHLNDQEEFGSNDKFALDDFCMEFATKCWLDEHKLDTLPKPQDKTYQTLKRFVGVIGTISGHILFDPDTAHPYVISKPYVHKQITVRHTDSFILENNLVSAQYELLKNINKFYIPKNLSIFDEYNREILESKKFNEDAKELTPQEIKYLNEMCGVGIKRLPDAGKFKQSLSFGLDDKILRKMQSKLEIDNEQMEMDDSEVWDQYAKDLQKKYYGVEITVNNKEFKKELNNDHEVDQHDKKEISQKLSNIFDADPVNGKKAARIIASIVHGGSNDIIKNCMKWGKEPFDGIPSEISKANFNCKIEIQKDGSYNIDLMNETHFSMIEEQEGNNTVNIICNDNSHIKSTHQYNLSFDQNGIPTLTLRNRSILEGEL